MPGEPARQPLQPLSAAAPPPAEPQAAVAAQPGGQASAEDPPLAQLSENTILRALLQLARDIRKPRTYIGYSALICFALARGCRPFVWEGETKIDVVASHAPWAVGRCTKECAVDAVVCCMVPAVAGGHAEMMPVSAMRPLTDCNHFVAAVPMTDVLLGWGDSIEALYSSMGWPCWGPLWTEIVESTLLAR